MAVQKLENNASVVLVNLHSWSNMLGSG
jgi:hypothetical protein